MLGKIFCLSRRSSLTSHRKTTLADFLMRNVPANAATPNISTNGISVSEWAPSSGSRPWRLYCSQCFTYLEGDDLKSVASGSRCKRCPNGTLVADALSISVWDFGGQEVFYPTHQFFLSDRTVYLVMFNMTSVKEQRLEYWLRQINALARDRPPIFLVGTHRDKLPENAATSVLKMIESKFKGRPMFGNIRDVFGITSVKKGGADELKQTVIGTGQKMLSSLQIPAYYLALKQVDTRIKTDCHLTHIVYLAVGRTED
jgi:GTPase SAR1 family protein